MNSTTKVVGQVAYKDAAGNTTYRTYTQYKQTVIASDDNGYNQGLKNTESVSLTGLKDNELNKSYDYLRMEDYTGSIKSTNTQVPTLMTANGRITRYQAYTYTPGRDPKSTKGSGNPHRDSTTGLITNFKDDKGNQILEQNPKSLGVDKEYPKVLVDPNKSDDPLVGAYKYDYTLEIQDNLKAEIKKIKDNLNIPSAYNRLELNKKFHQEFNRFHVQYPDYFMNNTIGYVFFTRPDLNLFEPNSDVILSQIANDPQLYYVIKANPETAKLLTAGYSSDHHFNTLLSNTVMSLDISDMAIDTLETGETMTGFKTQYAKSNVRSLTAGTLSITFPEIYNMAITQMHQLWCGYESGVYRGSLKPKDEYIWYKELDYACDIYYFLVDAEDMIIRYWAKYIGCFPLNVNHSVFSHNGENQINHPSLNISYAYFGREDMSLQTFYEFNKNSGGIDKNNYIYRANYIPQLGSSGSTWSGAPFIEPISRPAAKGWSVQSELYALRFKPSYA